MPASMTRLTERLRSLEPKLLKVCQTSGIPGCSIGVLHQGREIWKANLGYRNVEAKLPPQSNTIFNMDSVTKGITAAAFACLVNEGKAKWTTPIRDIIPDFAKGCDELDRLFTPLDLFSMRSGHTMLDSLSWQGHNIVFFEKSQTIDLWNVSPRLGGFRSSYIYNNWGYAVMGVVIEKLTGQKLNLFLKERFFDPLKLPNTKMTDFVRCDNSAISYGILDDMTPVVIPDPAIGVGTFMEGASGLLSTVDDLLVLYQSFMYAIKDQFQRKTTATPGSPFKECTTLVKGHSFLENSTVLGEQSYGCGWIRCQLPGPLGMISMNPGFVDMPQVTEGCPSRLCLYHQGLMPGSSANVAILPDTDTIIIILANSSPLGDGIDWLSQMLMEEIFETPTQHRHDYEKLAQEAAGKALDHIPSMNRHLEKNRIAGSNPSFPLEAYVGKYHNNITSFWIEICQVGDGLTMAFMGLEPETYELRHYHYDTFTWIMPFNEAARRGRFVHYYTADHFLIKFEGTERGIDRFLWHAIRDTGPKPYLFLKTEI